MSTARKYTPQLAIKDVPQVDNHGSRGTMLGSQGCLLALRVGGQTSSRDTLNKSRRTSEVVELFEGRFRGRRRERGGTDRDTDTEFWQSRSSGGMGVFGRSRYLAVSLNSSPRSPTAPATLPSGGRY